MKRGAVVSLFFFGVTNTIRLASNLTLAYLLFPGAFGLIAMVGVVVQTLAMISDVGIRPCLIQSKRGDDPVFLNTAWTIQVVRGVLLMLAACALAWPAAWWFKQPQLLNMILVVSLSAVFNGLQSTKLIAAERRLQLVRCLSLTLVAQVVAVTVMVVWAWRSPTVWALVANSVIYAFMMMVLSHVALPGVRNRLHWDRQAAGELYRFGRWVLLSTFFTLIALQADKLFLGRVITAGQLGVYQIAIGLSLMVQAVVGSLTRQVVYPALSQVVREHPDRIGRVYYRVRLRLDAIVLPATGVLIVWGPGLIDLMYDDRYKAAGWIFRILLIRAAMVAVLAPAENVLFAMGHARYAFVRSLYRAIWLIVAMWLGWRFYGMTGVVWAVGLSEIPVMVVLWWGGMKHGVWSGVKEARAMAMLAAGIGLGWGIQAVLELL